MNPTIPPIPTRPVDVTRQGRELIPFPGASELDGVRGWNWRWHRALVWSEWFAHSRMLLFSILAWLAAVWLLPLVLHPLWLLGFSIVFALVAGPTFGGADVMDGCEEFMLAFPATRSERFLARFFVGGGSWLAFTIVTFGALGLNLSDVLDRLFLNTGMLQSVDWRSPKTLYALVVVLPGSIFAVGFSIAALSRSRPVAFTAWIWAIFVALGVLRLGLWFEELRWERLTGTISLPMLVVSSAMVLAAAHRLYRDKEAGANAAPLRIPLSWWGWFGMVLAAAGGAIFLLMWLADNWARLL